MVSKELRDRTAVVYCFSHEQREQFYHFAKSKGSTFSKFVLNLLEEAMAKDNQDNAILDTLAMQRELQDLKRGYRQLNKTSASQAKEILRLKSEAFLAPSGTAEFSEDLLDVLRDNPGINSIAILDKLNVDPTDSTTVTGISRQLEMLEVTGFVKRTKNGWILIE